MLDNLHYKEIENKDNGQPEKFYSIDEVVDILKGLWDEKERKFRDGKKGESVADGNAFGEFEKT